MSRVHRLASLVSALSLSCSAVIAQTAPAPVEVTKGQPAKPGIQGIATDSRFNGTSGIGRIARGKLRNDEFMQHGCRRIASLASNSQETDGIRWAA